MCDIPEKAPSNAVLDQLHARKSVRAYEDRDISPCDRAAILNAACAAPTAGNQQMYTVLDITDPALREKLAETCDHQPFIASGKLVLIFLADCSKWYQSFQMAGCSPRKPAAGDLMLAVTDACIAAQNAVVAAHSLGLGSCYIGDIMENCETHRQLLHLPRYVFPAAMLVFGYPTEQQLDRPKPPRASLENIVFENVYPEMNADDLRALHAPKTGRRAYEDWITAFCQRKYNSDFAREMSRSVEAYLKDFAP